MTRSERVKVEPVGEREIRMTRSFNAPASMVFDAFTKPELVKRWLLGPPGWSMPVCEMDVRVGGKYRWVWKNDKDGSTMGMGGVYREVTRPTRLVNTERFDEAWYPGEGLLTTEFTERAGRTTMTGTLLYESREAREMVLESDMESGVNQSYDNLEDLLSMESK
jgi:uncharacterized protein YndB with AHSA1/START domain